jgi:hypothetical protein
MILLVRMAIVVLNGIGLPIPLRNLVFEEPGQYSFHLLCDGQPIADAKIGVR